MSDSRRRLRLDVTGAVQGVGFRPFVHRLATGEGLAGFVCNTGEGAAVEVEGPTAVIDRFLARLEAELRPPAQIATRIASPRPVTGGSEFTIATSTPEGRYPATVLPDLATCPECLREVFDASDRRHLYPFTTCVHCGPRYSIIEAIPYDRARNSMRHFPMCPDCKAEYGDPASRRFHAETIACPSCGPHLALLDNHGELLASRHAALVSAAEALRMGRIVALKGLGGFQLLADARSEEAIQRLREGKRRPAKPFAIMVATLSDAHRLAKVAAIEERLLASPAAPIVLLEAVQGRKELSPAVAPGNPQLGIMLPTTALHHLLMRELGFPIVATSGNREGRPIIADTDEAFAELSGIADLFLIHDRPIVRPIDDSVVRVIAGGETVLRLARGYAPLSLLAGSPAEPGLALGGHQKNAIALDDGRQIILGPHIGDLGDAATRSALERTAESATSLLGLEPQWLACDAHPDYFSTRLAERLGSPRRIPHHSAHVLAGMIDNGLEGDVLGVAWDGTGYGRDGTIWGGEFIAVTGSKCKRIGHLHKFRLPGGEVAAKEPRRSAFGALFALDNPSMTAADVSSGVSPAEREVLTAMLLRRVNAPLTSSAGRLFDAVAAILGLCQRSSFEGEAAMAVEFAADRARHPVLLAPLEFSHAADPFVLDWRPTLASIVDAVRERVPSDDLAAGFHLVLANAIVAAARRAGIGRVLLTGGCFQNARLTELAVVGLRNAGFQAYWHHRIPPNDGGLAAGQAAYVARQMTEETI